MNKIKLETIGLIKNSSLDEADKEAFAQIVEKLNDSSCVKILTQGRKSKENIKLMWQSIRNKMIFLNYVNSSKILSNEQKRDLEKIIINVLSDDEIKKIIHSEDVDVEQIENQNKEILNKYKKIKDNLNTIANEIKQAADNSVRNIEQEIKKNI